MKLPTPLIEGRLLRRYLRFFADVELADGRVVTAHTANTGSMRDCAIPGYPVLLSLAAGAKRKLLYNLELIRVNGHWVDIHTQRSNRVVEEALRGGWIADFAGFSVRPEYRFGDSRLDFFLQRGEERVLLEVKNVTLTEGKGIACFPDAVTLRGQKHLRELLQAVKEGYRGVIFFLVQRGEAVGFCPADNIDPEYGRLLRQAVAGGVEAMAWRSVVSPEENRVGERLPILL
jgi:sugar fermentation stimulation protein A